ncbi:MAG TPA: hypothetical protein VH186_00895 [Chloroflexia bacterium]|nr:hypothetical protein [Chloroflexia bacterium]
MKKENQAKAILYILDHIKHARFDTAGWGQPHLRYYKYEPDSDCHYLAIRFDGEDQNARVDLRKLQIFQATIQEGGWLAGWMPNFYNEDWSSWTKCESIK